MTTPTNRERPELFRHEPVTHLLIGLMVAVGMYLFLLGVTQ